MSLYGKFRIVVYNCQLRESIDLSVIFDYATPLLERVHTKLDGHYAVVYIVTEDLFPIGTVTLLEVESYRIGLVVQVLSALNLSFAFLRTDPMACDA